MNYKSATQHNKTIFFNFLFLFSSILLIPSCNNFMSGANLRDEVEKKIIYENAPSYSILVTSNYGKISPNGVIECKETDSTPLLFTADSDYQFIRWRIVDRKTGVEIKEQNYIKFDEINESNTSFTLEEPAPENILIEPYCEIRPTVVSVTPLYDSNGVYRDRRIAVMFDKEMDESAIYYNLDEQDELINKGYTLLKDEKNDDKCYGYWDGVDKKTTRFKNIVITKRKNQSDYLLCNYSAPYFDKDDSSVLRIDAKMGEDAPPEATDILVMLQQFGANINDNIVTLANNYKWNYFTNGKVDTDAPLFNSSGDAEFTVLFEENKAAVIQEKNKAIFDTKTQDDYIANNLKNKKLFVKGGFFDGGSGPNSLKWKLYKVDSAYYPVEEEYKEAGEYIKEGVISDLSIVGGNAEIKRIISSDESVEGTSISLGLPEDSEGLYRIDFICSDKNERESKKSYYFVNDTKAPKPVQKNTIRNNRPSANTETISWIDPDSSDFAKVFIEQYFNGEKTAEYEVEKGTQSRQFTGMSKGKYQYKLYSEDICGNRVKFEDSVEWQDDVKPGKPENVYTDGRNEKIRISYTASDSIDYDCIEISGDKNLSIPRVTPGSIDNKYEIIDLTNNTSYSFKLRTVDYAGNYSDFVDISEKAGVNNGAIVYAPGNETSNIFSSVNIYEDKNPIGVICDNSNLSEVVIWDLYEYTGYCWGKNDEPCSDTALKGSWNGSRNTATGLEWYNYILNNKSWMIDYQNGSKNNCHTIWWFLENKKNTSSAVTWFIPGITEFNVIISNYYIIKPTYDNLKSAGLKITDNGSTLYPTLFTSEKPYWTACPRYKQPYANAVMLNRTNAGIYEKIATNNDFTLYLSGERKEDSWYFKDEWQCEKSGNKAAMISHAMAQIDMD